MRSKCSTIWKEVTKAAANEAQMTILNSDFSIFFIAFSLLPFLSHWHLLLVVGKCVYRRWRLDCARLAPEANVNALCQKREFIFIAATGQRFARLLSNRTANGCSKNGNYFRIAEFEPNIYVNGFSVPAAVAVAQIEKNRNNESDRNEPSERREEKTKKKRRIEKSEKSVS